MKPEIAVTPIPTPLVTTCGQVRKAQNALFANYDSLPPMPWADVNALTGALVPGDLWVVGARPSNGKTTFCLNLFDALVRAGFPTLYIGAGSEGPPEDLRRQWAALRLGYAADAVLEGRWKDLPVDAQTKLFVELEAQKEDHRVAFFAEVGQKLTPEILVDALREFKRQESARYVILDHIHRLRFAAGHDLRRGISEATRWLRDQAAQHQWGLLIAAQLHRAPSLHGSLRDLIPPVMSDLKETGTLEEDAVVGLLLHRVKRADVTPQQIHAVSRGDRPVSDVIEPACVAVRVGKHRRRGYNQDKTAFLTIGTSGRLTDRAAVWRTAEREPGDEPPF